MVRIQPSWKPSSGFPQLPTAFRIKFQQLARYRGSSIACFFRFMFYLASTCYESSSQPFTSVFPQTGQALQLPSLCTRSCSLTQVHLANFHSSFRTPSKTEHYLLSLSFSQRNLSELLPAPSSSFYNSYFTVLHSLVFWHVHSPLKSGSISFTS